MLLQSTREKYGRGFGICQEGQVDGEGGVSESDPCVAFTAWSCHPITFRSASFLPGPEQRRRAEVK